METNCLLLQSFAYCACLTSSEAPQLELAGDRKSCYASLIRMDTGHHELYESQRFGLALYHIEKVRKDWLRVHARS